MKIDGDDAVLSTGRSLTTPELAEVADFMIEQWRLLKSRLGAIENPSPHMLELLANQLAAENVRRYLDGTIIGAPEPGTLAARVDEYIEEQRLDW